jgi:hypothetical protein
MKYPYMNMMKPDKKDYQARTRDIALYSYYEPFRHEDDEPDEDEDNHRSDFPVNEPADGEGHWYSGYRDQPPLPKIKFNKVTLQTILDLLPEGVTPADVKLRFTIDSGDMGVYGHEITFYYTKKLPPEPEKYAEDYATWKKLHDEWEAKHAAYEQWEKDKQVKELEEKLAKLKK